MGVGEQLRIERSLSLDTACIACANRFALRGQSMTYFARAASIAGKKATKPAVSSVLRTRRSSALSASSAALHSAAASARPRAANTSAHDSGSARVYSSSALTYARAP